MKELSEIQKTILEAGIQLGKEEANVDCIATVKRLENFIKQTMDFLEFKKDIFKDDEKMRFLNGKEMNYCEVLLTNSNLLINAANEFINSTLKNETERTVDKSCLPLLESLKKKDLVSLIRQMWTFRKGINSMENDLRVNHERGQKELTPLLEAVILNNKKWLKQTLIDIVENINIQLSNMSDIEAKEYDGQN